MTQSISGSIKAIMEPVIGHVLPQGEDIRYDPDFEKVETPNSSPKCDTLQFKRLASFLQKPWLAA